MANVIFKTNGMISEQGVQRTENLRSEIQSLLNEGTSETDIRLIGSILQGIVGTMVTNSVVKKNE